MRAAAPRPKRLGRIHIHRAAKRRDLLSETVGEGARATVHMHMRSTYTMSALFSSRSVCPSGTEVMRRTWRLSISKTRNCVGATGAGGRVCSAGWDAADSSRCTSRVPAFSVSRPISSRQKIRISRLKCGCRPRGGMGSFRRRATAVSRDRLTIAGLAGTVSRGYASAATDTGHKGDSTDASWAPGPSREDRRLRLPRHSRDMPKRRKL